MKNKRILISNSIMVALITCIVILGFMSISAYNDKRELQKEVNDLKEKVKDENDKFTSQFNENKKLIEEFDSYMADIEEGIEINEKYEKLLKEKDVLIEEIKQSEYIKLAQLIKEYSQDNVEFFSLYHFVYDIYNGYSEEVKIDDYILADKNLSIKEKMQIIANNLSEGYFGLPIEVEKIEERNGKKVAIINLVEHTEDEWDEWSIKFQGTSRERSSIGTLENNFIQPQYLGDWVDGIEILQDHGSRRAGHIGGPDWIVYREDLLQRYELEDFLVSNKEEEILKIIDGKILSQDGEMLLQKPVESGNKWILDNKLTVITRVGFEYYDPKGYSHTTIETLTLDLKDGTILKRYFGQEKGLIKEQLFKR